MDPLRRLVLILQDGVEMAVGPVRHWEAEMGSSRYVFPERRVLAYLSPSGAQMWLVATDEEIRRIMLTVLNAQVGS